MDVLEVAMTASKYSKTIDLRGFSNGVYMINTQIGDRVFTNKVTVQN